MINSIIGVLGLSLFAWGLIGIYVLTDDPFKKPKIVEILRYSKIKKNKNKMGEIFTLVAELGLPIAEAITMAYFIFIIMKQQMNNLVSEIKVIEGISQMLITRATVMNNDIIRIDTSVSSVVGLSPDLDRIARAQNFVEDGKIDARRD